MNNQEAIIQKIIAPEVEDKQLRQGYEYSFLKGTAGELAALVEKWDIAIAENEYTLNIYNDLVNAFNNSGAKGFNIKWIEANIKDYTDQIEAETNTYQFKGYDWYLKDRKEITLKDFMTDVTETRTPGVYNSAKVTWVSRDYDNQSVLARALQGNENFRKTCKGFAIGLHIDFLKNEVKKLQQHSKTTSKINAPIIATFCYLINDVGIMPKGNQTNADYCEEVCKAYNLPYTDKVRQNYNSNPTKRNIEKVITLILPEIPEKDREIINQYLNNKHIPNQKLYA